ncbi:MAG: PhoU domain-containing protein [Myxococcota bacterium]
MLKALIQFFRNRGPQRELFDEFVEMYDLTRKMIVDAGGIYWNSDCDSGKRRALHEADIEVNERQRSIRKRMVLRLATSTPLQRAHFMMLMSLLKDVERVGDYAKNLADVCDITQPAFPDDDITRELIHIRRAVEGMLPEVARVLRSSDVELAKRINQEGRDACKRCNALLGEIAASDYGARTAVVLALGARYYRRIASHLLNLISSVLMPLHKLDYFDEKELRDTP